MEISPSHQARRRDVALVAAQLMARSGIEGVTVRDVAAEAGFSTHIVSHYFKNKHELLLFTLRESSARSAARLDAAVAAGLGLQECLETLLPLDDERRVDCLVWFSFWARAVSEPAFAAEQQRSGMIWRDRIRQLVRRRWLLLGRHDSAGDDDIAQRLQASVAGIGIHGCFDPAGWSPARQRALLAAEVEAACAMDVPAAAAPVADGDGLARENARLRALLVEAMLENDRLKQSR